MAQYVLVHGGAHGGWCWHHVAKRLRAAGHAVFTPTLTGLGERRHLLSADTDLETHITDVLNMMLFEDLSDVILVGHSYGGMVITGVADRARARIQQLVFLDAAIPRDGEALIDWSPGLKDLARAEGRIVDGVELVLWPDSASFQVYGVIGHYL
jgi:pimeloyl-ACP methyl ester carboxylesterase